VNPLKAKQSLAQKEDRDRDEAEAEDA
jgi:hypothetical protein